MLPQLLSWLHRARATFPFLDHGVLPVHHRWYRCTSRCRSTSCWIGSMSATALYSLRESTSALSAILHCRSTWHICIRSCGTHLTPVIDIAALAMHVVRCRPLLHRRFTEVLSFMIRRSVQSSAWLHSSGYVCHMRVVQWMHLPKCL